MLVSDRTHPLDRDLDWAPAAWRRWYARTRWSRLAPLALLPVALIPILGDVLAFLYAKNEDPWSRGLDNSYDEPSVLPRLDTLGAPACTPTALAAVVDGELVEVRGRVAVATPLRGVLGHEGACRRLALCAQVGWVIHEAAVDFVLVGDDGARVHVHAAGARLVTRLGPYVTRDAQTFMDESTPRGVRALFDANSPREVPSVERVLENGEEVVIIGRRTSVVDPSGAPAGYREPPRVPALAGGPELPLLIARALEYGGTGA